MKLSNVGKGTYVSAKFDDATLDLIESIQKELHLLNPTSRNDIHSTIVYSRVKIPFVANVEPTLVSTENHLELWDTKSGKTLVLKLNSPFLEKRHSYSSILGGTYDFPEYKAHITLSYDVGPQFIDVSKPINIPIVSTHEIVEDLDLNWSESE